MPHKDPEAAKEYRRRRYAELRADPEKWEGKLRESREYYHHKMQDPAYRARRKVFEKRAAESRKRRPEQVARIHRRANLKQAYGLSEDKYQEMCAAQNGACAICKRPESVRYKNGRLYQLSVDHCHETGTIRGLLCQNCNHGLGQFGDNPWRLEMAAAYLRKTRR